MRGDPSPPRGSPLPPGAPTLPPGRDVVEARRHPRLGADRREQVAGLVHDISHTAFSHAVDFIVSSEEQDHHEELKPVFLERPDIAAALASLGFTPDAFYD